MLAENHCVVQICLWYFYTETRKKNIPGEKKKQQNQTKPKTNPGPCALALSLQSRTELCQYVFSWTEDPECMDFKLVGTICSGLVLRSHDNQFNYSTVYCQYMCWTFYGARSGLLDAYLWLRVGGGRKLCFMASRLTFRWKNKQN